MHHPITFINSSQQHQGGSSHAISRINSHAASIRYARSSSSGDHSSAAQKKKDARSTALTPPRRKSATSVVQPTSKQLIHPEHMLLDALSTEQHLSSALDPFIRLPIAVTEHEKSLLHFYFSIGRRWAHGTSSKPLFDTSLQSASQLLEKSSIYVLAYLVIAESILGRANGSPPTNGLFLRRAQVYRQMNLLLSDPQSPFYIKLCSFGVVAMMELYLFRPDLQAKHVQAMYDYMEFSGGLSEFFRDQRQEDATANIALCTGYFMHSEILFQDWASLTETLRRFVKTLKRITRWAQAAVSVSLSGTVLAISSATSDTPSSLFTYLQSLCDTYLANFDGPYALVSGAFNLQYHLCITQVLYNYDHATSIQFLDRLQYAMEQSSSDPRGLRPITITPATAIPLLGHVRGMISQRSKIRELELCMASLDASRVAPLLSPATRYNLAKDLLQCSFLAIMDGPVEVTILNDQALQTLKTEVTQNWLVKTGTPVTEEEDMRQGAVPEFRKRLADLSKSK